MLQFFEFSDLFIIFPTYIASTYETQMQTMRIST